MSSRVSSLQSPRTFKHLCCCTRRRRPVGIPANAFPSQPRLPGCETSPASAAIYCGHVGVLVYLQEHQIAILPDRRQELSIITAINNGHHEMVEYLLTVARAEESRIPELYTKAIIKGDLGSLRLLVKGMTPQLRASTGASFLERALQCSDKLQGAEIIRYLVREAGVPVDTVSFNGRTALHSAIKSGHMDAVDLLVDLGADLSAEDQSGQAALEYAASHDGFVLERLTQETQELFSCVPKLKRQKVSLVHSVSQSTAVLRYLRIKCRTKSSIAQGSQEQRIQAVERAWEKDRMNEQLEHIWVHSMSLTALQWYIERIEPVRDHYMHAAWISIEVLAAGGNFTSQPAPAIHGASVENSQRMEAELLSAARCIVKSTDTLSRYDLSRQAHT